MKVNSTTKDYVQKILEQFPYLSKHDINTIVNYGWRMLYLANLSGCDTLLISQKHNYWMYIGDLCKDPIKHFNYYRRQLSRKIRFLYRRAKIEWNGYYYCYLTWDEYILIANPKRGRKRKNFLFNNKIAFKSLDVCNLHFNIPGCIIKFLTLTDRGFQFYQRELKCLNPEIVLVRDRTLTFEDILVTNNKYEYI